MGGAKASSSTNTSNALSLTTYTKFLDSFPGPLNSSSSKDKVVKFLKERLTHYLQEECLTDAPSWQVDCRKVLWELLVLMAKHQGQLKMNYNSSTPISASKAAGLLRGAVTAAAGAAVTAAAATAAGTPNSDAGSQGGSGAGTPKAGAGAVGVGGAAAAAGGGSGTAADASDSELLKVLLPGAVASSASSLAGGMRVLSHPASEAELQATAAEMQVRHGCEHRTAYH